MKLQLIFITVDLILIVFLLNRSNKGTNSKLFVIVVKEEKFRYLLREPGTVFC